MRVTHTGNVVIAGSLHRFHKVVAFLTDPEEPLLEDLVFDAVASGSDTRYKYSQLHSWLRVT